MGYNPTPSSNQSESWYKNNIMSLICVILVKWVWFAHSLHALFLQSHHSKNLRFAPA